MLDASFMQVSQFFISCIRPLQVEIFLTKWDITLGRVHVAFQWSKHLCLALKFQNFNFNAVAHSSWGRHLRSGWPNFHSLWWKSLFTRHCKQIIKIPPNCKDVLHLQNFNAFSELLSLASEARLPCISVTKVGQVSQAYTVVALSYGLSPHPLGAIGVHVAQKYAITKVSVPLLTRYNQVSG